jgi:hypothetical protein
MSNSFYKLFEKIQNFKEQDEMNPNKVMQPNVSGDTSGMPNDPNMQLGSKNDISGEAEPVPDMDDTSSDAEDSDNLSMPEGSVDTDQIVMSLNKIKKMIPKFKTMDKDKAEQLDDLLNQTSSLVSSFSSEEDGGNQEEGDESEDSGEVMGDKKPSFGDSEGPPVAPTDAGNKDMSGELPAVSPADQQPEQS